MVAKALDTFRLVPFGFQKSKPSTSSVCIEIQISHLSLSLNIDFLNTNSNLHGYFCSNIIINKFVS